MRSVIVYFQLIEASNFDISETRLSPYLSIRIGLTNFHS